MRLLALLLTLLLLSPSMALAQASLLTGSGSQETSPSDPAETDASIDALVRIIENDQSRAALIERLQQRNGEAPSPEQAEPAPAGDLSLVRQVAEYTRGVAEGASATVRSVGKIFVDLQAGLGAAAGPIIRPF